MRHPLLLLSLCTLAVMSAPPAVALDFRLLSWGPDVEGLQFQNGSEIVSVDALQAGLSERFPIKSGRTVEFFRIDESVTPSVRVPLARAEVPEGIEHALLILAPSPQGAELAYSTVLLDDSLEATPENSVRFHNLSGQEIAVRAGAKSFSLANGQSKLEPYSLETPGKLFLQIAVRSRDGWKRVIGSPRPTPRQHRIWCFIEDGGPGATRDHRRVTLRVFTDYVPVAATAAPRDDSVAGAQAGLLSGRSFVAQAHATRGFAP